MKSWLGIVKAHWVFVIVLLFVGMTFGAVIFAIPARIFRAVKSGVAGGTGALTAGAAADIAAS